MGAGVKNRSNRRHGLVGTKIYGIWASMMSRCYNSNTSSYARYGGRGIKVCARWHDPAKFSSDMGAIPPSRSLDRINNDKGYAPNNCRWATASEQSKNRASTIFVKFSGKNLCLADWSNENGINIGTIQSRRAKGWTLIDAISIPVGSRRKSHRMITFRGRSMPISKWAEALGSNNRGLISMRLNAGWTLAKALTEPVRPRRTL